MKISIERESSGFYLTLEAENVKVVEDAEERIYSKLPDGKTDFKTAPLRDISDNVMDQLTRVLEDTFRYRERDYDASELVTRIFEKLPSDKIQSLITELHNQYGE